MKKPSQSIQHKTSQTSETRLQGFTSLCGTFAETLSSARFSSTGPTCQAINPHKPNRTNNIPIM